jgi:hypothetical protein
MSEFKSPARTPPAPCKGLGFKSFHMEGLIAILIIVNNG